MATLFQREGSAFWWIYYVIGAKRVRHSTGIRHEGRKNPPEAVRAIQRSVEEKLARQKFGLPITVDAKPLGAFLDEYLRAFKGTTLARYTTIKNNFLAWADGRGLQSVADITAALASEYHAHRQADGAASKTRKEEVRLLKYAWNEAKRLNYCQFEANPWEIKITVEALRDKLPFTKAELKAMFTASWRAGDEWMAAFVRLGTFTGARIESVSLLQWEQIGFEMNVINFEKSKTGSYTVALHPELKAFLTPLKGSGPVFPVMAAMRPTARSEAFSKRLKRNTGITGNFHRFRHTLPGLLAEAGVEKRIAMLLLNHLNEAVHDGYTHVDAARLLPELEKVKIA